MEHLIVEQRSVTSYDTKSQSSGFGEFSIVGNKDNVKVIIRVRPLNEREKGGGGAKKCVSIENSTTIMVEQKPDMKSFNFDFVGEEDIGQEIIFNQIARPIADCCLEGYNGSIFAYGQTGAGKTFTIQGPNIVVNGEEQIYPAFKKDGGPDQERRGIMQRSFEYLFDCIEKEKNIIESSSGENHFESLIRCSYLEIYNEQIMDLLEPTSVNLHIREDIKKGVYVEGLQEEVVQNAQDMVQIIQTGAKNRHVGCTSMNKESSRSHSVLTTIIETKSMKEGGVWNIKTSRFHIIDLAGSERSKYTNAVGERLKEAGMINKSLSALGNVINSLVDISEGKNRHVHYRDSKLTFLLRDSLGGNSKTVIIANISPSSICYGETISTLKFAQRAKLIRNRAVVNEDSSGTIQLLKIEIGRLKKELAENDKRSKHLNSQSGNQCSLCKALMANEDNSMEEEDEMLLDKSIIQVEESKLENFNGPLNEILRQRFKSQKQDLSQIKQRVVHLESLLSSTLDNLTSQQKYYDCELQKSQGQTKKYQQAVESYEKQCARDKMIIKFREDRISKLEANTVLTSDDKQKQIDDMKKEIGLWKESVDHNSQAAKLFAEKSELIMRLDQMKTEINHTPDSLSAQMRSLTELNESLTSYFRLFCEESKKEVETELSLLKLDYAEKMEDLNQKISDMKLAETDNHAKIIIKEDEFQNNLLLAQNEIERLSFEYKREKIEIERLNREAIDQVKQEVDKICENKTEQEKELQFAKIEIMEKSQVIDKEKGEKSELERILVQKQLEHTNQISQLQSLIKSVESDKERLDSQMKHQVIELEHLLDKERKHHMSERKLQEDKFDGEMREFERQMMVEQNDKQMFEDQCQQLSSRIRSLEEENESVQQSLLFKEEQILTIHDSIREKQSQINELEEKLKIAIQQSELVQESNIVTIEGLHLQIGQVTLEMKSLEALLLDAEIEKQGLKSALEEIKEDLAVHVSQKAELTSKIASFKTQIEDQLQQITSLEQQKSELNDIYQKQEEQISDLQETIQSEKNVYESRITEFQNSEIEQKSSYQEAIDALNLKMQISESLIRKELQDQITVLELDLQSKIQEIDAQRFFLEDFKQSQEVQLQDLKCQFDDEVQKACQALQEKDVNFEESLQKMNDQFEQDKLNFQSKLNEAFQQKIQQKTLEFETRMNQQITKHEDEVQLQQKNHIQELQDAESQLTIKFESLQQTLLKEQESHLTLEYETKQQELQNEKEILLASQQEKQLTEELIKSNMEVKKLQEQFEEIQDQNRINNQQHQEVINQQDQKMKTEQQNHQGIYNDFIIQLQDLEAKYENLDQEFQIERQSKLNSETSYAEKMIEAKITQDKLAQEGLTQLEIVRSDYANEINELKDEHHIQIAELQSEIEQIRYSLKSLEQTKIEMQTALLSKEQSFGVFKDEYSILEEQLQYTRDQLDHSIKEVQKRKVEEEKKNLHFSQLSDDQQHIQEELQNALLENSRLQQFVSLQEATITQANLQIANTQQSREEMQRNLIQEINSNKQELSHLHNILRDKENNMQNLCTTLDEREQQLEILEDKMLQVNFQYDSLFQSHEDAIQEINSDKQNIEDLQNEVTQTRFDLNSQQHLLDETIGQLNNEHIRKYQEQEQEHKAMLGSLKQEIDTYKQHCKELNHQIGELKQINGDQNSKLHQALETLSIRDQKDNEHRKALEKSSNDYNENQEKWKKRVAEEREEKEHIKREWERGKKAADNLKELIKLKDRQIEDLQSTDDKDKEATDRLLKENKDLKNQLTKREFEMKDVVRTLKFYSDEKTRLEKELDKLHRENDQLIGHKNPSQKIQHHVKIKEENNKLREENFKLLEELRKKTDCACKTGKKPYNEFSPKSFGQDALIGDTLITKEEQKKLKKENQTYQETINRLVDHILSQPSLLKAFDISEEIYMQQNGTYKVKMAMEIISQLNSVLQQKDREVKDAEREKKKLEGRLDIIEKEKVLFKQQLELIQNSSIGSSFKSNNVSTTQYKRSPIQQDQDSCQQEFLQAQNNDHQKFTLQSRIHIDGFTDDRVQSEQQYPKYSPPIYNFKLQKEKENLNSKKDLSMGFRSGSGKRTAYLSSNNGSMK